MLRRVALACACAALAALAVTDDAASAKPKKKAPVKNTKEEQAFRARFKSLKEKEPANFFNIRLAATDDPSKIPGSAAADGLVMVAGRGRQLETPGTLSPDDIRDVINEHLIDVKKCYKKQLE